MNDTERWWITLSKDGHGGYVYSKRESAEGHVREFGGQAVEVVPNRFRTTVEYIGGLRDLHPGDWPTIGRRAWSRAQQALNPERQ